MTLAACGEPVERLWVPPPPRVVDGRSILFAIDGRDGAEVFVVGATDGVLEGPASFDLEGGAFASPTPRIRAYVYEQTLEALGLASGRVGPGTATLCALEHPLGAFETELEMVSNPWGPGDVALDARVRVALFGNRECTEESRCMDFAAERVELAGATQVRTMVALQDRILLADTLGQFYTVNAIATVRRADLDGLPAKLLVAADDGEIWFGGVDGALMTGPLDGPYLDLNVDTATRGEVMAFADSARWGRIYLTGADGAGGPNIVQMHFRRDESWSIVHEAVVLNAPWWQSDARWTNDGHALVAFSEPYLMAFDGTQVRQFDLRRNEPLNQVPTGLAVMPDGRAFVGARLGALFNAVEPYDTWLPVETGVVPTTVLSLANYREGLFVGGGRGYVGQYMPQTEPCIPQTIHEAESHLVVPLGDDLYVAGFGDGAIGEGMSCG